ncbi:MAG: D-alanine--D-alanine ligase [Eubacteriales bacterium]|nr:D-alanine--D-alanine ligase [Eubacteriales bacterium]
MKVVVLAGGISTERDVSLISGKMIYRAVKKLGHQAVLLDVFLGMEREDIDHIFESGEDFAAGIGEIREVNPDISAVKAQRADGGKCYFGPNVIRICQMADVVFLGLHGADGEGGRVQAAFDLLGIRYTGTDFVSSALAMDKCLAKELFVQNGIPTPAGFRLRKGQTISEKPQFPCVVKVSSGGSSIGVSIVEGPQDYEAALADAFLYGDEVIVEQYIKGKELTCCVLDGKALPIVEIAPKAGFYDYKNKYQAGSTVELCPAPISAEATKRVQEISERVFSALRLHKYARMDFMMDGEENVYCLEANTLPGMTPTSLIPQEAAAVGIGYEQLCQKIIDMAFED